MFPHPVSIQNLTQDEAMEIMHDYPKRGWAPSLSVLLGAFLYKGEFICRGKHLEQTEMLNLLHSFFSQVNVHRIVNAVKNGEADDRVWQKLQHHLKLDGKGLGWMTPLWPFHAGWLKDRIIRCFDPKCLPDEHRQLLFQAHIELSDLIRVPMQDPFAESD